MGEIYHIQVPINDDIPNSWKTHISQCIEDVKQYDPSKD